MADGLTTAGGAGAALDVAGDGGSGAQSGRGSAAEPFAGRRAELAELHRELRRAAAGESRTVLVEGAAGIGKTALVATFLAQCEAGTVVRAGGEEAEQPIGFGVLEQLVRPFDPAFAVELLRRPPELPVVGLRLADLLDTLQRDSPPVVLVLDDVQWLDGASLLALVFALRRLGTARVLVVCATRDGGARSSTRLRRLVIDGGGARLRLSGLSAPEIVDLADALGDAGLPAAAAERLRVHTAGLPLHAKAMLEEVTPDALRTLGRPLPAPASYAVLVLGRLSACAAATRRLVLAAAVLGEGCRLSTLRELVGDDTLPALEEACEQGLLELHREPQAVTVAFGHPLTRRVVYDDLPLRHRLALHAEAAAAMTEPTAALEHRIAATLGPRPELAEELARVAAADRARGDLLGAAERLLSAAQLDAEDSGGRHLLEAVELMTIGGDPERAASLADAVAALAPSAARSYVEGLTAFVAGRAQEAEKRLRNAWEQEAAAPTGVASRVADLLCCVSYMQLKLEEAVLWGRCARESGRDPSLWLMTSLALAGRLDEPEEHAALPPGDVTADPDRLLARGTQRLWADRPSEAREDLMQAAGGLRSSGGFGVGLHALVFLSLTQYRLGDWPAAIESAETAVNLAEDSGQVWVLARMHSIAVMPHAGSGHYAAAEAHVRAAQAIGAQTRLPLDLAGTRIAAATIAVARGDHQGVVTILQPLVAAGAHRATAEPGVSVWPCFYADALVGLGRLDEADDALAPYEAAALRAQRRLSIAEAARVRGNLEAAAGRADSARAAYDRALAAADLPLGRALIQAALGAFLRRRGQRREAARLLTAAHETLTTIGAAPYAERCASELAACGLKPSPRGESRSQLTPRELGVARLAAAGSTNRQIAGELVVSINTVEFHLRNVFAKLGVRSRGDLHQHLDRAA